MSWFVVRMKCRRCGNVWKRRTKNPDSADPPCPNLACGEAMLPIGMDLSLNKAPASIGGNIHVKAIDETAKIVMEDHGMTDLRSDVRESETMAPKLPPILQAQADNFFGGPKGRRSIPGINPANHVRAALTGGLRDPLSTKRSIVDVHARQYRPPVHTVASDSERR
jgi:hypothetical protein